MISSRLKSIAAGFLIGAGLIFALSFLGLGLMTFMTAIRGPIGENISLFIWAKDPEYWQALAFICSLAGAFGGLLAGFSGDEE